MRGSLGELAAAVEAGRIPARGEVVIVLGAAAVETPAPPDVERAKAEVDRLVASGMGRAEAARTVAAQTGLARRQLY